MIKKHYIDMQFGQLHARTLRAGEAGDRWPLVLLHPMPYSSLYFTTIMPLMNDHRTIVAIDYPGCGGSDPLDTVPTIEAYAQATLHALNGLGIDGSCDFLGFHTGCLVAAEIAAREPSRTGVSILVDIPFFDEEQRRSLIDSQASHKLITEELDCLQKHWDSDVKSRVGNVPIERAFDIFADHMIAQGDGADGFKAAFNYDAEKALAAIKTPTLILATKSGLYDGTLAASKIVNDCELIEMPEITKMAFELGAERIAKVINSH